MHSELPTTHAYPLWNASSSEIPGPEPARTTVNRVISFLKRDAEYAIEFSKKELQAKKQVVETVNALIVVGAFIAGVQSQVLASTSARNETKTQVVANLFSFTGLIFDILGSSFGVLHAIELQKAIQQAAELPHSQSKEQLEKMAEDIEQRIEGQGDAASKEALRTLQAELAERTTFWKDRRFSEIVSHDELLLRHLESLFGPRRAKSSLQRYIFPVDDSIALGHTPMFAMSAGIVCLLVSVICFAAYSQPTLVLVACVVGTFLTAGASLAWHNESAGKTTLELQLERLLGSTFDRFEEIENSHTSRFTDMLGLRIPLKIIAYSLQPRRRW